MRTTADCAVSAGDDEAVHSMTNRHGAFQTRPLPTGYSCLLLFLLLSLFSLAHAGNTTAAVAVTTTTRVPSSVIPVTVATAVNSNSSATRESREIQCLPLRHTFGSKMGLDSAQVPRRAINGDHLTICSQEATCCTQDMETKLSTLAKQDYEKLLSEYVSRFKLLLISRTTKFDDYFTVLIRNARHNLHTMFIRTYGPLYEKNAIIFTELFDDLERYYRGNRGHVNLQHTMNRFFSQLFQKMFVLLNAQYTLDNTQLQCVARHMDKVKPFGDVAEKLSQQVKRAFTDARTFVQALAIGRDTARTASEVPISGQCSNSLTRMMYCPQCRGMLDLKPCPSYCLSVVKSCLGQHIELESEWKQYIDALLMLAERLRSPFNIETVVTPIDVKISEAIMNLQEQGDNISTKVFMECGKPRLSRRAASASRGHNISAHHTAGSGHAVTNPGAAVNLEQLSRDVQEKLGQTKDFWSGLPSHLCADYGKTFKTPVQEDCWNGLTKAKTAASASESAAGFTSRMTKSTDTAESSKSSSTAIAQQIQQLKLVTMKLKQAYNGVDVEWIETVSDDEDETGEPTSNTSQNDVQGSGSGDGEITDEPDDSDIEGSGTTPTTLTPVTVIHNVRIDTSTSRVKGLIITTPQPDFDFDSTTTSGKPPIVVSSATTTTTGRPTTTKVVPVAPKMRPSAASSTSAHVYLTLVAVSVLVLCWR